MKFFILVLGIIICFYSCGSDEDRVPYTGYLKGDIKYTGASNMKVDNVIITLSRITDNNEEEAISERLDEEGEYSLELPAGKYKMHLKGNRCHSDELPFEVTIKAGETRIKKINIEQLPSTMVILYNDVEYGSGGMITLDAGVALDIFNKYSNNILQWNIRAYPQPSWITFEETKGSVIGGGRKSIVFSIDKSKMPNYGENYSDVILTTSDNGSFTVKVVGYKTNDNAYIKLTEIGIGVQSNDITSSYITWVDAEELCNNSRVGGYSDWRMPSLSELSAVYNNRSSIGGFKSTRAVYWSSTSSSWNNYYQLNFITGETQAAAPTAIFSTYADFYCRCVRTLP